MSRKPRSRKGQREDEARFQREAAKARRRQPYRVGDEHPSAHVPRDGEADDDRPTA